MMNEEAGRVKNKLSVLALGIAFGIAESLFMMLLAWIGWILGYGSSLIHQVSTVYYGYAPTLTGGLWGGLWGLIDGFVFGIVAAWVYNLCLCCGLKEKQSRRV